MIKPIAALASWVLGSTLALAEVTADKILQDYNRADPALRARIEDHFDGMARGFTLANALLLTRQQERLFCQPGNLALTGTMIIDVLRQEVRELPALSKGDYGLASLLSLGTVFPCPK
jgi:hypothetical protein